MKRTIILAFLLSIITSCNSDKDLPTTDMDVARTFIKATLNNDYKTANQYMLQDEPNIQYLDVWKSKFNQLGKTELENYKKADIIINEISNVNDSVTIVNYSNSYKMNSKNKVKMVRTDGKWLVDFKYTFSGNM